MSIHFRTLSDHFLPKVTLQREILLTFIGAIFVGILAKISIPGNPVPISFSPQAALFIGAALGCRKGIMALVTYIGMGIIGLPVFSAGTTQGIARLIGPTGGYLIGFVVAAGLMGYFAEKGWDRSLIKSAAAVFLGNGVILFTGWAWLSYCLGNPIDGLYKGVIPFIGLDIIKTLFMALFLPATWHFIKKIRD